MDEEHLSYGRGGLLRLLMTRPDKLRPEQLQRLQAYFAEQPALQAVYEFCRDLSQLLRVNARSRRGWRKYVAAPVVRMPQPRQGALAAKRPWGAPP